VTYNWWKEWWGIRTP